MVSAGSVVAVAANPVHGFSKPTRDKILLVEDFGVEGDAHAGRYVRHRYLATRMPRLANVRQIHLMPVELLRGLLAAGYDIQPGELGENITTMGVDLVGLPLGAVIRLGRKAAVQLTGLRTPCVLIDRFRRGLKKEMISRHGGPKFLCGVMGVVGTGGEVAAGDGVQLELPIEPWSALPPL